MRAYHWLIAAFIVAVSLVSACTPQTEGPPSAESPSAQEEALTEVEVAVSCMQFRGFDLDPQSLENPGIVPEGLGGAEAEAYIWALLGDGSRPAAVENAEVIAQINDSIFDERFSCVDLARWYRQALEASEPVVAFEGVDLDDDPVIAGLADVFAQCVAAEGVSGVYQTPEDLYTEIQYYEFRGAEAEAEVGPPPGEGFVEADRSPLSEAEIAELNGLRAADFACSPAYLDGFATRINELQGIALPD